MRAYDEVIIIGVTKDQFNFLCLLIINYGPTRTCERYVYNKIGLRGGWRVDVDRGEEIKEFLETHPKVSFRFKIELAFY
ncbi:hypothetical protein K8R66_02230 [bacterium]|nr:hypothetical protein [bacterium]